MDFLTSLSNRINFLLQASDIEQSSLHSSIYDRIFESCLVLINERYLKGEEVLPGIDQGKYDDDLKKEIHDRVKKEE